MNLDGLSHEQLHAIYLSANKESSEAGWKLVEEVVPLINKLCGEYTDNHETLVDLISEMRIVVFKSLSQWNSAQSALTNWTVVIARRKIPRIIDRQHGPTKIKGLKKEYHVRESYEEDFDSVFSSDEIQAVYCSMAQYLTDQERQIVLLRTNGASWSYITKKLKLAYKTEAGRIYASSIQKLRTILLDE